MKRYDYSSEAAALVQALGTGSIVLVGMMGTGKSAIGRQLASYLSIPFVDSDVVATDECGMPIREFFDKYGEDVFRSGEARIIAKLMRRGPQVMAAGGGVYCSPTNQAAIRANGVSIWLKADAEILLPRVLGRKDRPLLNGPDPEGAFRQRLAERERYYAAADVTIELNNRQRDSIVEEILEKHEVLADILMRLRREGS